jgi:tRNA(Ile)-lysidine synthase
VAVSGGADSVALLDVLHALSPGLGLTLHIAHVHHGLRPEADDDARLVQALGERLGLPVHVERVAVRSGPPWDGLEAEGRRARAEAVGAARIATGHTADDQAETVLMRLLEGAGLRGLAGIPPRRGSVIRPLLEVRRSAIERHLRGRGLPWADDRTNRDRRFRRNRVRAELLPLLRARYEPEIVEVLCRTAALLRGMVEALERQAADDLR